MLMKLTPAQFEARIREQAQSRGKSSRSLPASGRLFRQVRVEREWINEEARTIEVSFSSEEPVRHWWGTEVLDHAKKSVRLERLNNAGAVLVDHNTREQVGVVEKAWIAERRGRALLRYGNSPRAEQEWQDIKGGIRCHISVGYEYHSMVLESSDKEAGDTYRCDDWEPLEISTVSIPADVTVGVGRSADGSEDPVGRGHEGGDEVMEKCAVCGLLPAECRCSGGGTRQVAVPPAASAPPAPEINAGHEREQATTGERDRVSQILALGEKFNRHEMATQAVRGGTPLEAFRKSMLEELSSGPSPVIRPLRESDGDLGMSGREIQRYSVIKMLRALFDPDDRKAQADAAFEFECSRTFQDKALREGLRKEFRGTSIPPEVLRAPRPSAMASRAFEVGDGDKGGYLVADELRIGSMIEYLWKRIVISPLITQVPNLVGNVLLPKETAEAGAYWIAEDGTATETTGANMFGQVSLVPKTVAIKTAITRKLTIQTSMGVEDWVRRHIGRKFGAEIERVIINGSGAGEPLGILKTTGIGSSTFSGAAVDWDRVVELITDVADANADVGRLAFLTNALVWGQSLRTPKVGSYPVFICDDSNKIAGYPVLVTNHVPKNLGAGANRSALIFGNFEDVFVGTWAGIDLVVDRISSGSGQIIIKGFQDIDVSLGHAESFSAGQDIDAAA